MTPFTIGAVLPHCKLFGGVRRFFELGELFIRQGHEMVILTPEGKGPEWFQFSGRVDTLENLDKHTFTILFITEPAFLNVLLGAESCLKVFYHVGPRANLNRVLKHKEVAVFSNSENMFLQDKKKYGIETIRKIGGVCIPDSPKEFEKDPKPFVIMCYGRLARKGKGTHIVTRAAEKLYRKGYNVSLLLFDTPLDEKGRKLVEKFRPKVPFEFVLDHPVQENTVLFKRADVFVAVEKKGGWSNTAAEAMAAGVPLIAGNTGTKDFLIDEKTGLKVRRHSFFVERAIRKLIDNPSLRQSLARNGREKIKEFSWEALSESILDYIQKNTPKCS